MLNHDFIPAVEIGERYEAEARPHLELMLDAVSGTLRDMPDLLRELRRLDEENDRLRAERDALVDAYVVASFFDPPRPGTPYRAVLRGGVDCWCDSRDAAVAAVRRSAGLEPEGAD